MRNKKLLAELAKPTSRALATVGSKPLEHLIELQKLFYMAATARSIPGAGDEYILITDIILELERIDQSRYHRPRRLAH